MLIVCEADRFIIRQALFQQSFDTLVVFAFKLTWYSVNHLSLYAMCNGLKTVKLLDSD